MFLRALVTAADALTRSLGCLGEGPEPPRLAPPRRPRLVISPAPRQRLSSLGGDSNGQMERFAGWRALAAVA